VLSQPEFMMGDQLAEQYRRNLPQRIRSYLQNERGVSGAAIDR